MELVKIQLQWCVVAQLDQDPCAMLVGLCGQTRLDSLRCLFILLIYVGHASSVYCPVISHICTRVAGTISVILWFEVFEEISIYFLSLSWSREASIKKPCRVKHISDTISLLLSFYFLRFSCICMLVSIILDSQYLFMFYMPAYVY